MGRRAPGRSLAGARDHGGVADQGHRLQPGSLSRRHRRLRDGRLGQAASSRRGARRRQRRLLAALDRRAGDRDGAVVVGERSGWVTFWTPTEASIRSAALRAAMGNATWPGQGIARALVLSTASTPDAGHGLHARRLWRHPSVWRRAGRFSGARTGRSDIARGIVLTTPGNGLFVQGYTLDYSGEIHPFGGAPAVSASADVAGPRHGRLDRGLDGGQIRCARWLGARPPRRRSRVGQRAKPQPDVRRGRPGTSREASPARAAAAEARSGWSSTRSRAAMPGAPISTSATRDGRRSASGLALTRYGRSAVCSRTSRWSTRISVCAPSRRRRSPRMPVGSTGAARSTTRRSRSRGTRRS